MSKEPAAGTGALISAGLYLFWMILDYAGVALTEGLKDAAQAFILILFATPLIAGLLIRAQVTPVPVAEKAIETERANAQAVVNKAFRANPATDPKPALEPKTVI